MDSKKKLNANLKMKINIFNVFDSFYLQYLRNVQKIHGPVTGEKKFVVTKPTIGPCCKTYSSPFFFRKESNSSRTLLHKIIAVPVF